MDGQEYQSGEWKQALKKLHCFYDRRPTGPPQPTGEVRENIRQTGVGHPSYSQLRKMVLHGLEIQTKKLGAPAENVIWIGCAVYGTAKGLVSYCRLLQHLGIDYTFLTKEHCCNTPFINEELVKPREESRLEQAYQDSKEYVGWNLNAARELGAKNLLCMCLWCCYLAKRFYPDSDINIMYFPDRVLGMLEQSHLEVEPKTIAYYAGGQHRKCFFRGEGATWDLNWPAYRKLLDRVDGLSIIDVPNYCHIVTMDPIFKAAQQAHADTIVTPCLPCYGGLMGKAPSYGVKVDTIADIYLEAATHQRSEHNAFEIRR